MVLKSWVERANAPITDFPIQNLPCRVISSADRGSCCAVAIGDRVLALAALEE